MCPYRKTVYQCNHSVVSPSPIGICELQRDYESGQRSDPCNLVQTHGRNNIRVPCLCPNCHQRKKIVDRQFVSVKTRLAELRKELEKKYDQCMTHLDEAGLEPEENSPSRNEPDPAQEFLKKKRLENDAHLMMFWDYSPDGRVVRPLPLVTELLNMSTFPEKDAEDYGLKATMREGCVGFGFYCTERVERILV
ncbi:hypothetical protein F5Y06DRAFT_294298 [Hypoxylon sp. FL0890]|nr:hypothetical protein F5Y06DRAFT_294298 [Hypoxylon sp. FL0890]